MKNHFVSFSGQSNVGFKQTVNEDYIYYDEDRFGEDAIFFAVADGAGSRESLFRPASIACNQVDKSLSRFYKNNRELTLKETRLILEEAVQSANDVLCGFKLGDEESRLNFAASLTCAFLTRDGTLTFAHAGNTRLYLIRDQRTLQLTKDQTVGQQLVDRQAISQESYYTAIERLQLYNELGMLTNPEIQTARLSLHHNDVIILTTDGVHYNYSGENSFLNIILGTPSIEEAAKQIVETALDLKSYPDNISTEVAWFL